MGVTLQIIPVRAYVLFPTQMQRTSLGILKYSIVLAKTNEFEGNIVIELSNTTPNPAKIYSNEGIAQFLFFKSDSQPETTYKSKNGKYQGQTTIQVAKIKK